MVPMSVQLVAMIYNLPCKVIIVSRFLCINLNAVFTVVNISFYLTVAFTDLADHSDKLCFKATTAYHTLPWLYKNFKHMQKDNNKKSYAILRVKYSASYNLKRIFL